jgi:hypothetical protein
VSESTTPTERPPYWSDCENMSLAELDRFIRDAAKRLSDPSAGIDGSMPRTREEFADLCALMRAKVDALKQDTTIPDPPEYNGPPGPGPFSPSDELEALYRWLKSEERRLNEEIQHGRSGNYVDYLEQQVKKLRVQVTPIERREQEKYDERLREYNIAREPYLHLYKAWRAEVAEAEKRREVNENLEKFVQRAYRRFDRAFNTRRGSGGQGPVTLDFEILPPGERTDEHVRKYYREVVSRGQLRGFSQDRLDKMLALPRSGWQKGKAGFYGYIVLMFDHTEKVLLECPVEGNAIYVLNSGEERLLRMSKQELIESSEANRIVHAGAWYQRLKDELGIE